MILRAAFLSACLTPIPALADTLTAARVIRANSVIELTDIVVADASIPGALTNTNDVIGKEARVTLYPGRPIMPSHIGPAALVTRNQSVTLVYMQGGLSIATEGRALSRGGVDDTVRVMNLESRTTVIGQVRADGTIQVSKGGHLE